MKAAKYTALYGVQMNGMQLMRGTGGNVYMMYWLSKE